MNLTIPKQNNKAHLAAGELTIEHITKLGAFWQLHHPLDFDGDIGPKTRKSVEDWTVTDSGKVSESPSKVGVFMVESIGEDKFKVSIEDIND